MGPGSVESDSPNLDSERPATAVRKPYQISKADATGSAALAQFTQANGQFLLPLVELSTGARLAVDIVIEHLGRQTMETILKLSAQEVARAPTPGKARGGLRWHGPQTGRVLLADRKLRVKKPRLRHKSESEVALPPYEALRNNGPKAQRMLAALLRGGSTRNYESVIPKMAATAGVKNSSIRR